MEDEIFVKTFALGSAELGPKSLHRLVLNKDVKIAIEIAVDKPTHLSPILSCSKSPASPDRFSTNEN